MPIVHSIMIVVDQGFSVTTTIVVFYIFKLHFPFASQEAGLQQYLTSIVYVTWIVFTTLHYMCSPLEYLVLNGLIPV